MLAHAYENNGRNKIRLVNDVLYANASRGI
jgi:hypothetical protein